MRATLARCDLCLRLHVLYFEVGVGAVASGIIMAPGVHHSSTHPLPTSSSSTTSLGIISSTLFLNQNISCHAVRHFGSCHLDPMLLFSLRVWWRKSPSNLRNGWHKRIAHYVRPSFIRFCWQPQSIIHWVILVNAFWPTLLTLNIEDRWCCLTVPIGLWWAFLFVFLNLVIKINCCNFSVNYVH